MGRKWAGPGPDLELWIQSLKSVINMIRNASVLSIIILEDLYWSEYFFLASLWLIFNFHILSQKVGRSRAGPLSAQWFFKTWIQLLELLINLIRNASVCSSIILKNLYWSEFGFLVSLWLNFHFFVFFRFQIFWEWAGPGPAHFFQNLVKSGPAHSEKS